MKEKSTEKKKKRQIERILVVSALPYANGPLHIGHIAGAYLPADIFVRYQKMKGNDIVYICGTDEHGVPITLRAQQEDSTPQEVVSRYHREILQSFQSLQIDFDHFSGTAREVHHRLSQEFFLNLYENSYVREKEIEQFYCEKYEIFLPDRFLQGTCPHCKFFPARGDECPNCGKWIEAEALLEPRCTLCVDVPILKRTRHWFLRLDLFSEPLKQWLLKQKDMKDNTRKFALGWLKEGLSERAITRDLKWGVPVPLESAKGKVLYVWFDALIGYISATIEWGKLQGKPDLWKHYWQNPECKLIHFIGKDNLPFHSIVWPALLMGQKQRYILPHDIPANEHLTIEGKKLSTSEGNVVWVDDFLTEFPSDYLRYYLSAMSPESKDSDFSWNSFQNKINSELVHVLGNFAHRTLRFIQDQFESKLPVLDLEKLSLIEKRQREELDRKELDRNRLLEQEEILKEVLKFPKEVGIALSDFRVREAITQVMRLAQLGNRYFDSRKPWKLVQQDRDACSQVLSFCFWISEILAGILYPFLPSTAKELWNMLGYDTPLEKQSWDSITDSPIFRESRMIRLVRPLVPKVEKETIQKWIQKFQKKQTLNIDSASRTAENISVQEVPSQEVSSQEVSWQEFQKLDLRIAKILRAEKVLRSSRLLKCIVEVGAVQKQIIASIAHQYKPEELQGREVLILNNLIPAQIHGETSEAMLLLAEKKIKKQEKQWILISPIQSVESGTRVK